MKKVFVIAITMILGLGLAAFAGPISGSWDTSFGVNPSVWGQNWEEEMFSLSSTLALTYTIGTWSFTSSSTFDNLGWSAQSFAADGALGAITFLTTMKFRPRTVVSVEYDYEDIFYHWVNNDWVPREWDSIPDWDYCWLNERGYVDKTYDAAFDDWTAVGEISIAGISIEGLFFLEDYAGDAVVAPFAFYNDGWGVVQTAPATLVGSSVDKASPVTTGTGTRLKITGTIGDLNITSYTYFNLTEKFSTATCGWSLAKSGTYTIASGGCIMPFTEEYIYVDGFSIGCASFAIGVDITCSGFNFIAFEATGLDLGVSGITVDLQVKFGEKSKVVALCGNLALSDTCFEFEASLDSTDFVIDGISIDGVSFEHTWNGVTFSSATEFTDSSALISKSKVVDKDNQITILVPVTGMTDADDVLIASVDDYDVGYYEAKCLYTEKYDVWEQFTITIDGDACCGGAFDFSVANYFGTKKRLMAYAYEYDYWNEDDGWTETANDYYWYEEGDTYIQYHTLFGFETLAEYYAFYDIGLAEGDETYERLTIADHYVDADPDTLFAWVETEIDASIGIGSAWSLTLGVDIDAYGWKTFKTGFEVTF